MYPLRGMIFGNFVIAECMKHYFNLGILPPLYFWRDQHGHELDLAIDRGTDLLPIEIKSGLTFQADWMKNLDWFAKVQDMQEKKIIYGGETNFTHGDCSVISWRNIHELASPKILID